MTAIVWFRRDLRLVDNPAWAAATATHDTVVPLFVLDDRLLRAAGPHRRDHLLVRLHGLDHNLARSGGRLLVRRGAPASVVAREAGETATVYWNDDYTPYAVARDRDVGEALHTPPVRSHGSLIRAPGWVLTAAGRPYRVFTPFFRRWSTTPWSPEPEPGIADLSTDPGDGIPALGTAALSDETDAGHRLEAFATGIDHYHDRRDRPDLDSTSQLSTDLKYGTLSPRHVAQVIGDHSDGRAAFVRQLCWRDFYAHILHFFPETATRSMNQRYDAVRWRTADDDFAAWATGKTGYPIVDAGMRQLLTEGWMHNRVRMITASFLVKDLLIDWRRGERLFRHHLSDADTASNIGNWQWVAGTGADAAPYFRILNPVRQSGRFDPDGAYIHRYIPELRGLASPEVHAPWTAKPSRLAAAGVELGANYPKPIVDHAAARDRTLNAFAASRDAASADATA